LLQASKRNVRAKCKKHRYSLNSSKANNFRATRTSAQFHAAHLLKQRIDSSYSVRSCFLSLRHFDHLFRNSIKSRRNSIH